MMPNRQGWTYFTDGIELDCPDCSGGKDEDLFHMYYPGRQVTSAERETGVSEKHSDGSDVEV
jgi:hypothetical protein